ncbi:MAG: aspartate/glutamate racemase family protein [Paracoccus sp. (in: a-proteobacteria)]|uniref:aspartate/glutamate racemase family protein n=1 Tax=Paracoccus sp. TaxID=267 RepID=UPI0026DF0445|nr:aspartate/glutamate racemase family protein [Paracoccus sp. (in: a-proteobacteria)]MDO5614341.1 aspartate/glutamate racemase family protein [Paracoccus sp. (in: a-proteobacteria)]
MCQIAAQYAPGVQGWTAPAGPSLISTPEALEIAAAQIAALDPPATCRGVIVAAFGDPGAGALAHRLQCPVIGIGAAAARAAAGSVAGSAVGSAAGRAFAVVTTTPLLARRIDRLMQAHAGAGRYCGCFLTEGDPDALMLDPKALDAALLEGIAQAARAGAACAIIGGGPLGQAAIRLAPQSPLPLIQPIAEAAKAMRALLEDLSCSPS